MASTDVTEEKADQTDHKVTVSIHQSESEQIQQTAPQSSMASTASTETGGHVTVIKLEATATNAPVEAVKVSIWYFPSFLVLSSAFRVIFVKYGYFNICVQNNAEKLRLFL